jgi:hypothetical protein
LSLGRGDHSLNDNAIERIGAPFGKLRAGFCSLGNYELRIMNWRDWKYISVLRTKCHKSLFPNKVHEVQTQKRRIRWPDEIGGVPNEESDNPEGIASRSQNCGIISGKSWMCVARPVPGRSI